MTDLDSRLPWRYRRPKVTLRMLILASLLVSVAFWGGVYELAVWLNHE